MTQPRGRFLHRTSALAAALVGLSFLVAPIARADGEKFTFNIPAENTAQALSDYSKQANIQLVFPYDAAAKYTSVPLNGPMTRQGALDALLANTGLEVAYQDEKTITLRVKESPAAEKVTEVTVTGTHIRGGNPTSPVHTLTQKDIEASGYSQIGDLMRSLPENFSGGQNPEVLQASATNAGNRNLSNASTVNLRGLGTDATLVLLNGHRLTGDAYFQGADISVVPLAAVRRIEVVPDGASALYGSDAVAGVVNMILRKDYDGGEVSGRYGSSAQGGGAERNVSLLEGVARPRWYALGSLEVTDKDGITAAQRHETYSATQVTTLVSPYKKRSAFFSAGFDVSDKVSLSFDGLVSDRSSTSASQVNPTLPIYTYDNYTPSYNLALGLDWAVAGDWRVHVAEVASGSRNSLGTYTSTSATVSHYKNDIQSTDVTADGTVFELPSGPVKAALGAGFRTEKFRQGLIGVAGVQDYARNISYGYVEVLAPLVSPSTTRVGLHELELSASSRTEKYSDFGTTSNPKFGLRYVPFSSLTLRGTWGKSFRAPAFLDLYQKSYLFLWQAASLGRAGPGTALMTFGGNPGLKPETSTSWTFGADFVPLASKAISVSATYFDIDYTDRIVQPVPNYSVGLSDPIYADFVETSPSATRQAELISKADYFFNYSGVTYDPTKVVAVLQDKSANAAAQTVKGLDLSYRQHIIAGASGLDLFANATWLNLHQRTISTAPSVDLSGTIFNVPKVKARGGVSWTKGAWSATGIINYVGKETDNAVTPSASVASWTTADATLVYRFADRGDLLKGTRFSLSAVNLFDRAPPYTLSPTYYPGLHFDSTNASIVGRFLSLTIAKAW